MRSNGAATCAVVGPTSVAEDLLSLSPHLRCVMIRRHFELCFFTGGISCSAADMTAMHRWQHGRDDC